MSKVKKMTLATILIVGTGLTLASGLVSAQAPAYPSKPVAMVVSFPPGGSSDFFTRLVADGLSKKWGQPVVVENRPGAGGNIGAQLVARAPADGYMLYMGSISTNGINPSLYEDLSYDPLTDFASISRIATVENVLVVNPDLPVKTVSELLDYFRAHPDKAFYASPGAGTSPHLSSELFKRMANIPITHVPYRGSNPLLVDVMAGTVPMAIDNLPAAIAHIRAGKLRPLAVTSPQRAHALPDVPTLIESGIEGYDVTSWWALFAPSGTSAEIVEQINRDVVAFLEDHDTQEAIKNQGAVAAPSSTQELDELVASEVARWGKVIKDADIKIE